MIQTKTGSVTRTLDELSEHELRKKDIARTTERLKVLEQLEKFRENKMRQEL